MGFGLLYGGEHLGTLDRFLDRVLPQPDRG